MAINPLLLNVKPISEITTVNNPIEGHLLFYDGSDELKKVDISEFQSLIGGIAKPLAITDASPTVSGWYKPTTSGTYANAGNLVAQSGYDTLFYFDGTTWSKVEVVLPAPIQNITQNIVAAEQVVPADKTYNTEINGNPEIASDIVFKVDKNTGENVNYRETTTYHDGSIINDDKVDGVIYKKIGNKYYKMQYEGVINVKWFGAKGDGVSNDTQAFNLALKFFDNIYIPKGVYKINVELPRKVNFIGDGSLYTILKPFDVAKAVLTYRNNAPYWTFNTKFEKIGFESENKTGVGFTFGYTDLNTPVQNTEFYTNVVFENCYFKGFEKGVMTPTGNIGCDFINCGGAGNKYLFYFLDAKNFGEIMHSGCKTFLGGEFSGNDVVIYNDNKTDGFGQIIARNVIFEGNKIVFYSDNNSNTFVPILFDGCWDEANGKHQFPNDMINIDIWNGTTKTTKNIEAKSFYLKGKGEYLFKNGRVGNIDADGNLNVLIENCVTEETDDYGTQKSVSKNGAVFELVRCQSYGGSPKTKGLLNFNPLFLKNQIVIGSNPDVKTFLIPSRYNKQTILNSYKKTIETQQDLVGTFSVQGTQVAYGIIFENCTEWDIPFVNNSDIVIFSLNDLTIEQNKFFFISVDVKADDLPNIVLMNDSGKTLGRLVNNSERNMQNEWFTLGIVGFSDEAVSGLGLWLMNKTNSVKIRMSAFQCVKFQTMQQLKSYFESQIFAN